MRKLKDMLRLRAAGLTVRQISISLRFSVGVVSKYLQLAEQAGLIWPLPDDLDDSGLEAATWESRSHRYGEQRRPRRRDECLRDAAPRSRLSRRATE